MCEVATRRTYLFILIVTLRSPSFFIYLCIHSYFNITFTLHILKYNFLEKQHFFTLD